MGMAAFTVSTSKMPEFREDFDKMTIDYNEKCLKDMLAELSIVHDKNQSLASQFEPELAELARILAAATDRKNDILARLRAAQDKLNELLALLRRLEANLNPELQAVQSLIRQLNSDLETFEDTVMRAFRELKDR